MIAETSAKAAFGWKRPIAIALVTTACVTALSYLLPESFAATGVGLSFLVVTYFLALREDDNDKIRSFGLSFGGLLELSPIDPRRVMRDALGAIALALAVALVIFPAFWFGFVTWWNVEQPFDPAPLPWLLERAPGELLVVALSEEAFYRGYLQSTLDR